MIDLKIARQNERYDSSICCMMMLLDKYKQSKDRKVIGEDLFFKSDYGVYIMDFEKCLEKYEFDFEQLKGGLWFNKIEKVKNVVSKGNPVVMKIEDHFKENGLVDSPFRKKNYQHFTICVGANRENLYFADPCPFLGKTTTARGYLERKIQDFHYMHHGHPQQSSWIIKGVKSS